MFLTKKWKKVCPASVALFSHFTKMRPNYAYDFLTLHIYLLSSDVNVKHIPDTDNTWLAADELRLCTFCQHILYIYDVCIVSRIWPGYGLQLTAGPADNVSSVKEAPIFVGCYYTREFYGYNPHPRYYHNAASMLSTVSSTARRVRWIDPLCKDQGIPYGTDHNAELMIIPKRNGYSLPVSIIFAHL